MGKRRRKESKLKRATLGDSTPPVRPPRFDEWLEVYFLPYDGVASVWDRFPPGEEQPQFAATDDEIAELFTYTMLTSGSELAAISDAQLGNGLDNMLNSHFSSVVDTIRRGDLSSTRLTAALQSLSMLYRDCLTRRAPPVLGHLSENSSAPSLSFITYMLWDVTPLSYWPDTEASTGLARPIVLDVMAAALESPNPAVVESGLHGLGHAISQMGKPAIDAIDRFIASHGHAARPELLTYAKRARTGRIL